MRELVQLDDDEIGVPREYWHDTERVEAWVQDMKDKRKEKWESGG